MPLLLPIKVVFLLLVRPSAYIEFATKCEIENEFNNNNSFLEQYPLRQLPPEEQTKFRDSTKKRTNKIRASFFSASLFTLFAILFGISCGCLASWLIGKPFGVVIPVLQVLGAGVLLSATLALLGKSIESWGGGSIPEKTNVWLFKAQYWIGTAVIVFSLAWI